MDKEAEKREKIVARYGERAKYVLKRMDMRDKLGIAQWQPKKKLNREEMEHMRALRQTDPQRFSPLRLAKMFGVSLEAATRILHSKFVKSETKEQQHFMPSMMTTTAKDPPSSHPSQSKQEHQPSVLPQRAPKR